MAKAPTLGQITLKKEIESAISKHENKSTKPPFSNAELVVMAILCMECEKLKPVKKRHIHLWITTKFPYYRDRALLEFTRNIEKNTKPKINHVVRDLDSVLNGYETPLSSKGGDELVNSCSKYFTVPPVAGRVFLRQVLHKQPSDPFPFLKLPAELRIRIYEMVFSFPEVAIGICEDDEVEDDNCLCLWQREHDPGYSHRDGLYGDYSYVVSRPMQAVFALLFANKQIYNEAVPYFYRINHFRVNNMRNLVVWVENLPPSRLEHVRHLSFRYTPNPVKWLNKMGSTFAVLALHNALRKIEIETNDEAWFRYTVTVKSTVASAPSQTKPKYKGPSSLPHMRQLAKLVGIVDRLSFRGECPRIEEYLRAKMKDSKVGKFTA